MLRKKYFLIFILTGVVACLGFMLTPLDNEAKLKQIAKEYKSYTIQKDSKMIITDSAKYQWTISLCRPATPAEKDEGYHIKVDSLYLSKVIAKQSPHGDKLYKLYIKDYTSYKDSKEQPIGQVIVKETWNVKEIKYNKLNKKTVQVQSKNNGKWYTPTTKSELFIMYKENESDKNDKGWVYGIVNLEDKKKELKVLKHGKLSNCISCHTETKYDRIFGVK